MTEIFKKSAILAAVSITAISLVSASAMAADVAAPADMGFKPYVSVFAGASFLNDVNTIYDSPSAPYSVKANTGYLLGGVIGLKWNKLLRTEIELSHSSWNANSFKSSAGALYPASGSISAAYLLGNVWLDVPTQSAFTPYVGGGLGVGWAWADVPFNGNKYGYGSGGSAMAYQLGAGVKIAVSDQVDLDLGYRFKALSSINFADRDGSGNYNGATLNSHNIQLGVTYQF
jgi:opacity protein-like surface antigen